MVAKPTKEPEAGDVEDLEEDSAELELGEAGVEAEDVGGEVKDPYDPSEIRISHKQPPITTLTSRVAEGELDLSPSFQRRGGIWSERTQGRLIESVLLRIPLPAFYFDATDPDRWLVVDGLQRLTALCRYILPEEVLAKIGMTRLVLAQLEFLRDIEGHPFEDLARRHRRTIEESQVSAYLIEPGTPDRVKFNVFKRINTGGLPLSAQEIRHALNQGKAAALLEELAESAAFRKATSNGISGTRMADRECVLRFLAFTRVPPEQYQVRDFDYFLSEQMQALNSESVSELRRLTGRFTRAMGAAHSIFSKNAFRKMYGIGERRKPINKALFETWSVNLDQRSDDELARLTAKREEVMASFVDLMNLQDKRFETAVSQGTGDIAKVQRRFSDIRGLLDGVLS